MAGLRREAETSIHNKLWNRVFFLVDNRKKYAETIH
jgi:hypothetical protein